MTFRQFLINNYWGKGYSKIPFTKKWVSYYKGGPRNFLTLFAIGVLRVILDKGEVQSGDMIMIILSILFILWVLFTGFEFPFSYWQRNPVKWEEIKGDMMKKWLYGQQYLGSEGDFYPMTSEQLKEWSEINIFYIKKFSE